ncbi:MAG: helix-turn-helix transcriptional regulator [Methylomonas sp.]|nr:helix-turn-helix transcriptional regulator [Methylomonas sp.]
MTPQKRNNSLLAELQQLCSLGMPSELVMPDLFKGLTQWMSADNGQFIWVDAEQRPCNFYCGSGEATTWRNFPELIDQLFIPGWNLRDWYRRNDSATLVGGIDDKNYYRSSFYGEIMRAVGGECSMCIVIRDAGGRVRGSMGLNRDRKNHPFTSAESKRYEQFGLHLGQLFADADQAEAAGGERIGERGMAVFDYAGKLLYGDEAARQLLFLAGHSQLTRSEAGRQSISVDVHIRRVCTALQRIEHGKPAVPPWFELHTPWGRIAFHARSMPAYIADRDGAIGMDVVRYIPRRMAVWRQIRGLGLPLRQRQVCLDFADNCSLSDIASRLGISRNTVIGHLDRLYERFSLEPGRVNLQEFLSRSPTSEPWP